MTKKQWTNVAIYGGVIVTIAVTGAIISGVAKRRREEALEKLDIDSISTVGSGKKSPSTSGLFGKDASELTAQEKADTIGVYLRVAGTATTPVKARTEPVVDNKWPTTILHEYKNSPKGAEIGRMLKVFKGADGKTWIKFRPNQTLYWGAIPYNYAYIRADVGMIKREEWEALKERLKGN